MELQAMMMELNASSPRRHFSPQKPSRPCKLAETSKFRARKRSNKDSVIGRAFVQKQYLHYRRLDEQSRLLSCSSASLARPHLSWADVARGRSRKQHREDRERSTGISSPSTSTQMRSLSRDKGYLLAKPVQTPAQQRCAGPGDCAPRRTASPLNPRAPVWVPLSPSDVSSDTAPGEPNVVCIERERFVSQSEDQEVGWYDRPDDQEFVDAVASTTSTNANAADSELTKICSQPGKNRCHQLSPTACDEAAPVTDWVMLTSGSEAGVTSPTPTGQGRGSYDGIFGWLHRWRK